MLQNWFQNRRAKSKQDTKKQTIAFSLLHAMQQPNFKATTYKSDSMSPAYCAPDLFALSNLAIMDATLPSGLGMNQAEYPSQMLRGFTTDNCVFSPMQQQGSQNQQTSLEDILHVEGQDGCPLTQAQFDTYCNYSYAPATAVDSVHSSSAVIAGLAEIYDEYLHDPCNFNFEQAKPEQTSALIQHSQRVESHFTSSATDVVTLTVTYGDESGRHVCSTNDDSLMPSKSFTAVKQESDDPSDIELTNVSSSLLLEPAEVTRWIAGALVPVDYVTIKREFQNLRNGPDQFAGPQLGDHMEQPIAHPSDDSCQRNSPTAQMVHSMKNSSMAHPRAAMPSTTIAARRLCPRPTPLATDALRTASDGISLPVSPRPSSACGQTLRRIKSSQTMNGIANGRIQKKIGSAQRSPSDLTYADTANAGRYACGAASYPPANVLQNSGLSPLTILNPSAIGGNGDHSTLGQLTGGYDGDLIYGLPLSNFSPPGTPMYFQNLAYSHVETLSVAENTPPQSASATQQYFCSMNPHMQSVVPFEQTLQSQGIVTILSNERSRTRNAHFNKRRPMNNPTSYIMTKTSEALNPHKGIDTVPKTYTFSNYGPESFEKSFKHEESTGPVSSASTTST